MQWLYKNKEVTEIPEDVLGLYIYNQSNQQIGSTLVKNLHSSNAVKNLLKAGQTNVDTLLKVIGKTIMVAVMH